MSNSIYFVVVLILIIAWYLSFSATRLDRCHHRVETSWEHLDALLQRRAALALEIAHQSDMDPATEMILTTSAYQTREAHIADREDAESSLSESLKFLHSAAQKGEINLSLKLVDELSALTEKIRTAVAIHLEAINSVKNLRNKLVFRFFHLAGSAKWPEKYHFEDDEL
jgi:hypothetical protein